MHFLTILSFALTLALASFTASAEDTAPVAPPTPAATPAAPVTPPASGQPVAPSVARKPEEDSEPGAFARRLAAAKAVITGNHASQEAGADKDKQIAALQMEVASLTAQVTKLNAVIQEAVDHVNGIAAGTANPTVPPNAVAQAAGTAVQNSVAAAVRSVGIPTTALAQPAAVPAAAATPAEAAAAKEDARLARLDAVWKDAGYDRAAMAGAN